MPNTPADTFETRYAGTHQEWFGGDASRFQFFAERILLKSGDVIVPQRAGVTAIVGSNNAGKSTILSELNAAVSQDQPGFPKLSLESVVWSDPGNIADLFAWIRNTSSFAPSSPQNYSDSFNRLSFNSGPIEQLAHRWLTPSLGLQDFAPFLIFYGNAEGRLHLGSATERRQESGDPPIHPIHILEDSKELRDNISEIAKKVFHQPLTLDQLGANIRLRVGSLDLEAPRVDNISNEYRKAMAELRPLEEQGDGMRSFFGQILPINAATFPMVILDEPEAFLHPPQARALGLELGKLAKERGVQVIVATHDRNLLSGLLDADGDVSVVRISREDSGHAHASQLNAAELNEIWSDPVLKYTNVLDALFHRVVVLAEAEGDCGYLAAAFDSPERQSDAIPRSEILFLQTSGKAGLVKVAAALKAVGVPVIVAPDFDIVCDSGDLKRLMNSLGGEWGAEEEKLWKTATNSIRSKKSPASIGTIVKTINDAFVARLSEDFSSDVKKELDGYTRTDGSPWAEVKKHGVAAFEKEERAAVLKLLAKMEACGIVPVRVGELERLAPEVVAKKGTGWLPAALALNAQSNKLTQEHIDRIALVAERLLQAQTE